MTRKNMLIGGILAAMAVLAVAAVAVWMVVSPGDAPEQVNLSGAVSSLEGTQVAAGGVSTSDRSGELAGPWTLTAGGQSFVGYRVKEELANRGAFTAAGRTTNVTGTLRYSGGAITEVAITADMTALQSDSSLRDNALRRQALETNTYPKATFTLTQPIEVGSAIEEGRAVTATATGDLTLHGVTRSVSIAVEGQLANGRVVVVGSTDILFADHNIAQPRAAAVLSVDDRGVLELQLVFEKSASQG